MLPATIAGGFIALGLVLMLAAVGITIEFGGGKVADLRGTPRRLLVGVVGIGLCAWGLWSVVPRSYQISNLTVIPQDTRYSKPCPKKINVLVAIDARAAPGDVRYLVYFREQHGLVLHHGK